MSAEAAVVMRSWKVGHRTVSVSIPRPVPGKVVHAVFEWDPDVPTRLTDAEWLEYRNGRHIALTEIAKALQINVGVLDV